MSVVSFRQKTNKELALLVERLNDGEFSETTLSRSLWRLLARTRINQCKRVAVLMAGIASKFDDLSDAEAAMFKWGGVQAPTKQLIAGNLGPALIVRADHLVLQDGEQPDFELHESAVTGLLCSIRVAAELIGLNDFRPLVQRLMVTTPTLETVEEVALSLAKAIDRERQRLNNGLLNLRKQQAVEALLLEDFPDRRFCATDVDSRHALQFWLAHSTDPNLNVKMYRTVHRLFVCFVEVLNEHLATSTSSESFEADQGVNTSDAWSAVLNLPTDVKFVVRQKMRDLNALVTHPPSAWRLYPSLVWLEVFGPAQEVLKHSSDGDTLRDAMRAIRPHHELLDKTDNVLISTRNALFATLHILLTHRSLMAIPVASALDDEGELGEFLPETGLADADDQEIRRMQVLLLALLLRGEQDFFVTLRNNAKRGHDFTDRAGFRKSELDDADIADTIASRAELFIGAFQSLVAAQRHLKRFHPTAEALSNTQAIFEKQLRHLYPEIQPAEVTS